MINGVSFVKLNKREDARGWLSEFYREDETFHKPAMAYISETKPGVVRGPHEHVFQTDLFVFLGPGLFKLFLWDNRKDSSTYGETAEMVCGEGELSRMAIIVPPGVVHGYKCISDVPGWVINLPDKLYAGKGRREEVDEIRWENDKDSSFIIN